MEGYAEFYGFKDSIAKLSDLPKLSQQVYMCIYNLAN